jgi:hypothetical protein
VVRYAVLCVCVCVGVCECVCVSVVLGQGHAVVRYAVLVCVYVCVRAFVGLSMKGACTRAQTSTTHTHARTHLCEVVGPDSLRAVPGADLQVVTSEWRHCLGVCMAGSPCSSRVCEQRVCGQWAALPALYTH